MSEKSIAIKCKIGADAALKLIEQGKSSRQANEEFKLHTGHKLRYRNRADFINILEFYASAPDVM